MISTPEKRRIIQDIVREVRRTVDPELYNTAEKAVDEAIKEKENQRCQASLDFEDGYEFRREGRLWSSQEEFILRHELVKSIELIATMHRRTPGAIRERLKKMGIISDYSLLV